MLVKNNKVSPKQVAGALRRQQADKDPAVKPTAGRESAGGLAMQETIRVSYDRLEGMVDTVGELVIAEAMISQDGDILSIRKESIEKKLHNLRMISRKLQEMGTAIRMVPIAGTFQKMARMSRDLSKKSGKIITFRTHGEETELDRAYVDKIGDPLVHMMRNAVDHGMETPRRALESWKKRIGHDRIKCLPRRRKYHC